MPRVDRAVPDARGGRAASRKAICSIRTPPGRARCSGCSGEPACLERLGAARVHVGSIARSGVGSEALDLILRARAATLSAPPGDHHPRRRQRRAAVAGARARRRDSLPFATADVFRCHPGGTVRLEARQLAAVELLRRARRRWLRPIEVHERAGRWIGHARAMRAHAKVIRSGDARSRADAASTSSVHFRQVLQQARPMPTA